MKRPASKIHLGIHNTRTTLRALSKDPGTCTNCPHVPRTRTSCSLLFGASSPFQSPRRLSTGSPSAPWDITYCATWRTSRETAAAHGYRKQRCVRGYRTKRSSIPRPMEESHTGEGESNSTNLFRTYFLVQWNIDSCSFYQSNAELHSHI